MSGPSALPYRPIGLEMWDAWYVNHDDTVHMFHLQRATNEGIATHADGDLLGHATSVNLVDWTQHAPAFGPGEPGALDDLQPWTGCVYEHDGRFLLFYTMRSSLPPAGRVQRIGLATSDDLQVWTRYPHNPVITPDPHWYHSETGSGTVSANFVVDARDLIIQPDPDGPGWYGFYAARTHDDSLAGGAAIATVHSLDLETWEHRAPAFSPGTYACLEVPDVFAHDGRWYLTALVGNRYGNRSPFTDPNCTNGTVFAVADAIAGPYRELDTANVLLGGNPSTGYSCRSVVVEGVRHVLYTEPTLIGRDRLSLPLGLKTESDGRLALVHSTLSETARSTDEPELLDTIHAVLPSPHWPLFSGTWQANDEGFVGAARAGWQVGDLGWGGDDFEAEAEFATTDASYFGFVVRPDRARPDSSVDIACGVDTVRHTVSAAQLADFLPISARQFDFSAGTVHLRVKFRWPVIQLFANDELILQCATSIPQTGSRSLGLIVENGTVAVSRLRAWELRSRAV
jgi:beta-fructofuranosidase